MLGEAGADCGVCAASRANTYISIEGSALKAGDETLTYFSISGLSNEWASHAETEDTDGGHRRMFSLLFDPRSRERSLCTARCQTALCIHTKMNVLVCYLPDFASQGHITSAHVANIILVI